MNGSSGPHIKVEKDNSASFTGMGHTNSAGAAHCHEERQVPANNEKDCSTHSTGKNSPQQLVKVGELSYREITIKIFTDSASEKNQNSPASFFFEPMALLDPKSVIIQPQKLFKKDVVRFSIQMWNQDLRSKVLDHLRLDHPEIKEKNVHVMPYEEVQLVGKPESIHQSIKIMEEAIPYHRLNEKLGFFLLCDSPSTAVTLADNLRHYPEFVVRKWQLNLECRGLALDSLMTAHKSSSFKFVVSTLPDLDGFPQDGYATKAKIAQPPLATGKTENRTNKRQVLKDSQEKRSKSRAKKKRTTAVPVFSVKECTNPAGKSKNRTLGFSKSEFKTKTDYGKFDPPKRCFTVKKPGMYQFVFTGHALTTNSYRKYHFQLQVDRVKKSTCRAKSNLMGLQQVSLSSRQQLQVGQPVSMSRVSGGFYEAPNVNPTTFSCKFIAPN